MDLLKDSARRTGILVNLVILGISLYVSLRQDFVYKKNSEFENLMIESFAPIQRVVIFTKTTFNSFFNHYLFNVNASKENVALKKDISILQNELFNFEELGRENRRLKSLLEFSDHVVSKKVLAQIVAMDSSSDYRAYRINKGSNDGLTIQATVVTGEGLVGYIFRLTENFADIITILDSNNRVDAIISRIRSHGIVEGRSSGTCTMKYVYRTDPVILNDKVLTSGLGNLYPKGIKIGYVTKIQKDSYGMTQYLEITPSVDFDTLEEVIVLITPDIKSRKKEWKALDYTDSIGD